MITCAWCQSPESVRPSFWPTVCNVSAGRLGCGVIALNGPRPGRRFGEWKLIGLSTGAFQKDIAMSMSLSRAMRLAVLSALPLLLCAARTPAADEPVRIDTGSVSGDRDATDAKIRRYKGIPFAAPP